jgi:hypothetical protein
LRDIYRRAALADPADRAALVVHPQLLVLDGAAVAEARTRVAVADGGRVVGFAATTGGGAELEDE